MVFYPINLNIKDKKCVVIGGGIIATRKIKSLLVAQAQVLVISPQVTSIIQTLIDNQKINYIARDYQAGDIKGCFLVICATNNKAVNKMIAEEAERIVSFEFVWFTDGMGWISARNNLRETFDIMDNIYNIADMKNGIMKKIFK